MAARAREALADPMLPPEAKAHVRQMLSELEAQEGQLAEVENQAHSMEALTHGLITIWKPKRPQFWHLKGLLGTCGCIVRCILHGVVDIFFRLGIYRSVLRMDGFRHRVVVDSLLCPLHFNFGHP